MTLATLAVVPNELQHERMPTDTARLAVAVAAPGARTGAAGSRAGVAVGRMPIGGPVVRWRNRAGGVRSPLSPLRSRTAERRTAGARVEPIAPVGDPAPASQQTWLPEFGGVTSPTSVGGGGGVAPGSGGGGNPTGPVTEPSTPFNPPTGGDAGSQTPSGTGGGGPLAPVLPPLVVTPVTDLSPPSDPGFDADPTPGGSGPPGILPPSDPGPIPVTPVLPPLPDGHGAVPEPSAWMILVLGFGLAGAGLRRRRLAA